MKNIVLLLLTTFMLTGCIEPQPKEPESITLKQGLRELAEGLDELKNMSKDKKSVYGLVPSEIEVDFDISINNTKEATTTIGLVPSSMLNIGSNWTSKVVSDRGNHIKIKFRNILFTKKDEAVYSEDILKTIQELLQNGVIMMSPNLNSSLLEKIIRESNH